MTAGTGGTSPVARLAECYAAIGLDSVGFARSGCVVLPGSAVAFVSWPGWIEAETGLLATRASRWFSVMTVMPPKVASVLTLAAELGNGLKAATTLSRAVNRRSLP